MKNSASDFSVSEHFADITSVILLKWRNDCFILAVLLLQRPKQVFSHTLPMVIRWWCLFPHISEIWTVEVHPQLCLSWWCTERCSDHHQHQHSHFLLHERWQTCVEYGGEQKIIIPYPFTYCHCSGRKYLSPYTKAQYLFVELSMSIWVICHVWVLQTEYLLNQLQCEKVCGIIIMHSHDIPQRSLGRL